MIIHFGNLIISGEYELFGDEEIKKTLWGHLWVDCFKKVP